jgi:hypothetical protein
MHHYGSRLFIFCHVVKMSNRQIIYLQSLINKKIIRDEGCLRKLVAHQNLSTCIYQHLKRTNNRINSSSEGFLTVLEEVRSWVGARKWDEIDELNYVITIGRNCQQLADLWLDNN